MAGVPTTVSANPAFSVLASARQVLLLQGPVGPFYDRLARWLQKGGASVRRIVFQGGDAFDCRALTSIEYHGPLEGWPAALAAHAREWRIDCIVLFGQSRAYHHGAKKVALDAGIPLVVLEEGYFRPGFFTMELGGVNGFSSTLKRHAWQPRDATPCQPADIEKPAPGGLSPDACAFDFQKTAWHACLHYLALRAGQVRFPLYRHHRAADPLECGGYWFRSFLRKLIHAPADRHQQRLLFQSAHPYFLVPLQHDGDAQIRHHSVFPDNRDFIRCVIRSFARFAGAGVLLVFRQHPQSRGGRGNAGDIALAAAEFGVPDRVRHLVEGDTPGLVSRARGVVVINSTVGLLALQRKVPLAVLGEALYKHPALTFNRELDRFWDEAQTPNAEVADAFLAQIKNLTQVPGSLYAMRDEPLRWDMQRQDRPQQEKLL